MERPLATDGTGVAEQEFPGVRLGKLGRAAQPALLIVEVGLKGSEGRVQQLERQRSCARLRRARGAQNIGHMLGRRHDSLWLAAVDLDQSLDDLAESGATVGVVRREVRPGKEGTPSGVRKTLIGQQPCPLIAWTAAM